MSAAGAFPGVEASLINTTSRPGGRLNLIDVLVVLVVLLGLVGAGLARSGKAGIHQQLKGDVTCEFDLFIRGAVVDPGIFKVGEKAFITLRNQPYAALTIRGVKWTPRSIGVAGPDGVLKAVADPAEPFAKDMVLTMRETAQLTEDAVVLGGNKIKVGVPIDLEGFRYRLRGSIIDVRILDQK